MSKFIITEEEKKHIKGLYEQEDMSQQTQMVTNDFKSGPAVYYGKEIKLKDLEKQGYSMSPGTPQPKYGLKDINFEVYATTKSAAEMDLMKKLSDAKIPSDRNSGMIFSKPDGQGAKVKWIQFIK